MTYNAHMIGERIKEARKSCNMTKSKLAEKCELQQYQTITAWESGNSIPSLSKLLDLCDILNCDIGYLLGEYPEKTRIKSEICTETGLSENAVHKLTMFNGSKSPFREPFYTQFLDFYSMFIEDVSIWGMLSYMPGKILQIEKEGLSKAQEDIFEDEAEAIKFYKYQMQECIMHFLDRYFDGK